MTILKSNSLSYVQNDREHNFDFICGISHRIFKSEKNQVAQKKTAVTLLPSNESHHVRYQIKLYRFLDLYKTIYGGTKTLSFSKLSIEVGYILLKNSVQSVPTIVSD